MRRFCVSMLCAFTLLIVGCGDDEVIESEAEGPDATWLTTQADLAPSEVGLAEPHAVTAGGTVELLFPDGESRSMAWTVHAWPESGEVAEPIFQLIADSTLGCEGCPDALPWSERRAVELTSIEGVGPDTVIIPEQLDPGRYALCEAFTGTPCFEVEVTNPDRS